MAPAFEPRANDPRGNTVPAAGAFFSERYRIDKELGRGGMGQVFQAHDLELDRDVALKVLAPGAHGEQEQRRFEQEARAAGALEHPNVVAVHDVGTHGGERYIISELLHGKTLRETFADEPLPLAKALDLARQFALGLGAAHEKGVIHRDLKPENLFVTDDGTLKILDFGIAKAPEPNTTPSPSTDTGAIVGTVGYMSPEQVRGRKVDPRADIFSFGAILYEMLAGRRAFAGTSAVETAYAILNAEPAPLPHEVPRRVAAVVRRCLAKDPAHRYASARALRTALELSSPHSRRRWREAVEVALLCVALAWTVAAWRSPWIRARLADLGRPVRNEPRQLALLPFRHGGGPDAEALSAGVVEILNHKLRQLEPLHGSLRLVSSSDLQREGVVTPGDARRAFGARLALTGTMQWAADAVGATIELVDTESQNVLESRRVELPRSRASALPGVLVDRVSQMLALEIRPEAPASPGRPAAPGAYELYLQGRGYLQRYDRLESLDSAMAVLEKALARAPDYAPAWAGKAEVSLRLFNLGKEPRLLADARESAQHAILLDENLVPARVTMGLIELAAGRHAEAVANLEKAIALEPGDVDAVRELANAYDAAGRMQEAEARLRHAIELRPNYWAAYKDLGLFYHRHGRIEDAIPPLKNVIDLTPDNYMGYANLAATYLRLGRYAEAAAMLERSLALSPTAQAYSNLGTVQYFQKQYREAAENHLKAIELSPLDDRTWGNLADAYRWVPGKANASKHAYREAVAQVQKQLAVNPKDAELRSRLATYEVSLGDSAAALRDAGEALRTGPGDGQVLFRAALVYEQSGMRERALSSLRSALDGGFAKEEIEKAPPLETLRQDPRYREIAASIRSTSGVGGR
jgi:tetratricopeptide (TPR) repeat protein/TolB-like protein